MKRNMGNADRMIRLIIAAMIVILYFTDFLTGTWSIILLVLAGVFVTTSAIGFCPLYAPLGINTCSIAKSTK
ncbi:YgaP family membrane protein [Solitalea lacus]|uniref:YgaP family membrane protein n=1 Tax=Solitalea lacus TaxID=2911172 RepID=UPI001EDA78BB|nr:DUF2892 domain-containing protein [Solitalea lacus]UKJ06731.1 DUF2892 domain-containing protein [Solitalea lacus]